jgi:predicted amidohydrolase YtcJ
VPLDVYGSADIILTGGRVRTFDPDHSECEAIAISGNRILAIGSAADIRGLAGPHTELIDIVGATVIPGFNDTHAHLDREGLKLRRLSLAGGRNIAEVLTRISTAAAMTPAGRWIVTMPVGEPPYYFGGPAYLAEGRMPTRDELDRAAPDNPVCISAAFGNWGKPPCFTALNTAALHLNGIDRHSSPACAGVEIMKDEAGEPTGVIIEHNPRPTIDNDLLTAVPRFSFEDRRDSLVDAMRLYNAVGTTSIYEGHGFAPRTIAAFRELWEKGKLTTRVGLVMSPTWKSVAEARAEIDDWKATAQGRGLEDPWFKICGLHVAFGGDPKTAALSRRSLPDTGWAGFVEQANDEATFLEYAMLCAEFDIRLNTIVADNLHRVVPLLQKVAANYDLTGRRWVIQHIARCRNEDLAVLKRLGLLVTTIPVYYLWKGGTAYLADVDGGECVVPHRAMLDAGLHVSSGTDNIPYDPAFTLWTMMCRQERTTGRVLGRSQCLTGEEALRLLTVNGAHLTFDENDKGPLRRGFLADLTVLDGDPTTLAAEHVRKLKCLLTMVDGKIVHRAL